MRQLLSYRLIGVCEIRLLPLTVEFAASEEVPLTTAKNRNLRFKLLQCIMRQLLSYRISGACAIRLLPLTVEFAASEEVPLTAAKRRKA